MEKIDKVLEIVKRQNEDIKGIKDCLSGSQFGDLGLVAKHSKLEREFVKTRDEVKKVKVVGSVLGAVLGGLISVIRFFD